LLNFCRRKKAGNQIKMIMKYMFKTGLNFLLIVAVAWTVISCGGGAPARKKILIPYPNWAEGIAMTHLAKVVLDKQGYDVDIKPIEPGPIYASLSKGDADVFLDAWLPYTHAEYWQRFGDKIDKIGVSFDNGTTGLVVPDYVPLNSITELNDQVDKFGGKIIGIGSGAGIHANTEKAIDAYKLNFTQVTSSGAAMIAELKKATNAGDWIVVTGWKPHFMWAQYKLKYLNDPKGIFPKDECQILARKGFTKDYPDLAVFFKNFNLEESKLYELMANVEEANDPLKGAETFYLANKAMVDRWMSE